MLCKFAIPLIRFHIKVFLTTYRHTLWYSVKNIKNKTSQVCGQSIHSCIIRFKFSYRNMHLITFILVMLSFTQISNANVHLLRKVMLNVESDVGYHMVGSALILFFLTNLFFRFALGNIYLIFFIIFFLIFYHSTICNYSINPKN